MRHIQGVRYERFWLTVEDLIALLDGVAGTHARRRPLPPRIGGLIAVAIVAALMISLTLWGRT